VCWSVDCDEKGKADSWRESTLSESADEESWESGAGSGRRARGKSEGIPQDPRWSDMSMEDCANDVVCSSIFLED